MSKSIDWDVSRVWFREDVVDAVCGEVRKELDVPVFVVVLPLELLHASWSAVAMCVLVCCHVRIKNLMMSYRSVMDNKSPELSLVV